MSQLAPIFGVFIAKEDMPSKLGGLRHAVFGARRLVQDKDASEISLGGRVLGRSVANCCKSSLLRGTPKNLFRTGCFGVSYHLQLINRTTEPLRLNSRYRTSRNNLSPNGESSTL